MTVFFCVEVNNLKQNLTSLKLKKKKKESFFSLTKICGVTRRAAIE